MTDELTPMLRPGRSRADTLIAAHERAVDACCTSAESLDLHMCCASEGACTDELHCPFYLEALAYEVKRNRDAAMDVLDDMPIIGHDQSQC